MNLPEWFFTLQSEVFEWLFRLQDKDYAGRFRFALNGSVFFSADQSGLDASALALKITYMLGALDRIPKSDLSQWVDFIRSFQSKYESAGLCGIIKRKTGFFIDRAFIKQTDEKMGWGGYDEKTRRAVTRQACAALLCAGENPNYPVYLLPQSKSQVFQYLEVLDWEHDPWGAGSHASHLIFLLNMNKNLLKKNENIDELIRTVFDWLDGIRNPHTGSWYTGDPSTAQKINSAMKVLTGYAVLGKSVEKPEALIDYCLSSVNSQDGCHNADILFVLHYCYQFTKYREVDVRKFCWNRIPVIEQFRKPDGGFSFYLNSSQTTIYGVPIAKGLPESDIHGTVLFLWSLKMIVDILGYADQFPWKMPIN